jgi:phage baseplate assembly protein W
MASRITSTGLQSEIEQEIYRDLPMSFNVHPVTGNMKLVANAESIKQSVKNIVLTNFYERPYQPEIGGNILSQLFENMSPITEYSVTQNIRRSLENSEPRAIVEDIRTTPVEDQNTLRVTIKFSVRNIPEPIEVDVLLERVR